MTLRIIYETRGRAKEYAPLSVRRGPYIRCGHGCKYCFNLGLQGTYADEFAKSAHPAAGNFLDLFEKDCRELAAADDTREILISFTTDPYQPLDVEHKITRSMIEILIKYNLHFTVLTKGGSRSTRDFDLLASRPDLCRYGATLVLISPEDQLTWEPYAAPTIERLAALERAHGLGIPTWVSMEPVIFPWQTIKLIRITVNAKDKKPGIVDEYRIGKFNHSNSPDVQRIIQEMGYKYPTDAEWQVFVLSVKKILDENKCRYIFKRDLLPYLNEGRL